MSPPIRSPEHQARLRAALAGGILGVVATDHAPFNSSQKAAGAHDFRAIPNGVNGIEERLHVTWDALVAPGAMCTFTYYTHIYLHYLFNSHLMHFP